MNGVTRLWCMYVSSNVMNDHDFASLKNILCILCSSLLFSRMYLVSLGMVWESSKSVGEMQIELLKYLDS